MKLLRLVLVLFLAGLLTSNSWAQENERPNRPAPKENAQGNGKPPQEEQAPGEKQGGGEAKGQPKDGGEAKGQPQDGNEKRGASQNGGGARPAPAPKKPKMEDLSQVQLQVFISEMSEQGLRTLGTNLSYTRFVRGEEQSGSLQEITTNVFNPEDAFAPATLPIPQQGRGLRPNDSLSGFGITGSVIDVGYGTIDFLFRGLERKADTDIVSKPELLVVNNGVASISAGGQIPYQAVKSDKGKDILSIQWEQIGVDMKLKPTILSNDLVSLNIQQLTVKELSRFDKVRGLDLPVFAQRTQTGNVLVPNGRTIVIGGLTSEVVRKTERRVPILGKVPVLGAAFRSRTSEANFTTLMIFVSPTVVDVRNPSKQATSALEFWRDHETEWANQEHINREFDEMQYQSGTQ